MSEACRLSQFPIVCCPLHSPLTLPPPPHCRDKRGKKHPHTPDVHQKCSKRAFDGQVRKWRRLLHEWDLPDANAPSPSDPTNEPKNEERARQTGALPLKIPSAMRPTTKRHRPPAAQSFLSPTAHPPESKVQKRTWAEAVAPKSVDPSAALMAKWRDMATRDAEANGNGGDAIAAAWEGAPEVDYS